MSRGSVFKVACVIFLYQSRGRLFLETSNRWPVKFAAFHLAVLPMTSTWQ